MSTLLSSRAGGDGARHVTVTNQPDARTGSPHRVDVTLVARPVEDYCLEVVDVLAPRLGHLSEVVVDRRVEGDGPRRLRAHGDLVHVDQFAGGVHGPTLGHDEHGKGSGPAFCCETGPVNRIDGHVHLGTRPAPHSLAVVEHRRVVLLTLSDDDDPVDVEGGEMGAHGVDRGSVDGVLVPASLPTGGGHGGGLGHPD